MGVLKRGVIGSPKMSIDCQVKTWTDWVSIGVVESHRHVISTSTTTVERRYYMTSIKAEAVLFASAVRGHWGIENT